MPSKPLKSRRKRRVVHEDGSVSYVGMPKPGSGKSMPKSMEKAIPRKKRLPVVKARRRRPAK